MAIIEIGYVEAIYRYPVKSMRGEPLATAALGWHGLDGDRRLGLRRLDDRGGFPWLTAGKLPDLIRFTPERQDAADDALPTHVRTPEGEALPIFSDTLAALWWICASTNLPAATVMSASTAALASPNSDVTW